MHKLIATLRAQGTHYVVGTVLADNRRMLSLARELGFTVGTAAGGEHAIRLALQADGDLVVAQQAQALS